MKSQKDIDLCVKWLHKEATRIFNMLPHCCDENRRNQLKEKAERLRMSAYKLDGWDRWSYLDDETTRHLEIACTVLKVINNEYCKS